MLSRNVVVFGIVSLLADVSGDMVVPLLPAFVVTLGGGAAYIGVIEGAAEGTAALLKYVSGRWADRVRRLLPLAVVGYALAASVRPFLAVAQAPVRREPGGDAPGRVPGRLLTAIGVFTVGNSTDALLLLRAESLGVPTVQLPLLWAALHVVRALASWPLGRVADQLGRERTLIVGWLWYAACYAGFAAARVPAHFWILFAAYGLVAALTEGTERAMVADAVPPETRGLALGIYNLVTGVGLVAASVLAGQIWERASPTAALLFGAFLAFGASAVLRFGPRPGERAPVA